MSISGRLQIVGSPWKGLVIQKRKRAQIIGCCRQIRFADPRPSLIDTTPAIWHQIWTRELHNAVCFAGVFINGFMLEPGRDERQLSGFEIKADRGQEPVFCPSGPLFALFSKVKAATTLPWIRTDRT